MNLGVVLQALVDRSDCSKPPCNLPQSALPYLFYPAFPDSLQGKVCDLTLLGSISILNFFAPQAPSVSYLDKFLVFFCKGSLPWK